jgi:nuclear-control-of-ATPase protein 2
LADGLDQRRDSEGKEIRIADSGLRIWTDRVDVFGIPSSLVAVGLAKLAHVHLTPYWPQFKLAAKESLNIAWSIFKNRFWGPFYGIVQGLINKDSGVLAAFDVENEEKSLDNMLEDLGLGDGTEETRKEALQSAARLYEDQLANGVIRSAVRGRLVRLLLIQVQQLKAGLLHAMSSIDVLVAANRLNIQLLAAIPAVLIVYVGTRLIYRSLFTIRSKDLRSIRDVHAEMAEYLDEMEMAFLLVPATPTTIERDVNGRITLATVLQPVDLGEFVLRVYSYLILLKYASPLFPYRATNAIHKAMEELVTSHRLGVDRQVSLLRLIKQKHMDLLKYL